MVGRLARTERGIVLLSHAITHMFVPYSDPHRDVLIGDIIDMPSVRSDLSSSESEKQMRVLLQEPLLLLHPITLPCP